MTIFSSLKKQTTSLLILSSIAMLSFNSHAGQSPAVDFITNSNIIDNLDGTSTVSVQIRTNNECGGNDVYFGIGGGFSDCRIYIPAINGTANQYLDDDSNGRSKDLVIAKFADSLGPNFENGNDGRNASTIGSAIASDWEFTNTTTNDENEKISGDWELKNKTSSYPDIYFWIAKAGSHNAGFNLFWEINNIDNTNNQYCNAGGGDLNFSLQCMNLAQAVTTGSWATPVDKGLSHLTFFGGLCTENCDGPDTNTTVPEPTTLAIFALGLLGLGARRKQIIKAK